MSSSSAVILKLHLTVPSGMRISRSLHTRWGGSSKVKGKPTSDPNLWLITPYRRYFWVSNDALMSQQRGVFRVNCIDCLDRTNVVEVSSRGSLPRSSNEFARQSAFSRHILNKQLSAVALFDPSEAGKTDADVVFNDGAYIYFLRATRHSKCATVWANNGDAISRA